VLHLLRGEDLELLSRELGVVACTLSLWREQFLAAGQLALKGKAGKTDVRDEQISRLKKRVGELTMDNELLQEKAQRLEAGLPLAYRRSRR
jgi:transposase-like protein